MPPKIRKGTGFSDKAEGCCAKCCATVCRMSAWNKLMCWSMIALVIATTILLIGGGVAVVPNPSGTKFCGKVSMTVNNVTTQLDDPTLPVILKNVYTWYLASTGIVVIFMIVFMSICCISFVGLCCGFKISIVIKIFAFIGLLLFGLMLAVYMVWLAGGTYLISTYSPVALLNPVCQGIIVYILLLYTFLIVLIAVMINVTIWSIYGKAKSVNFSKLQTVEKGTVRK